jgi:hypothetical protein
VLEGEFIGSGHEKVRRRVAGVAEWLERVVFISVVETLS